MTVTTTASSTGPVAGDGSNAAWPFTFPIQSQSQLKVIRRSAAGVETVVPTSDYGLALVNEGRSGGTVTYPLGTGRVAVGESVTVRRNPAFTQPTNLRNQGSLAPETVEGVADRAVYNDQHLLDAARRSLRVAESESDLDAMPSADTRAGRYLSFDADGQPTTSGTPNLTGQLLVVSATGDGSTTAFALGVTVDSTAALVVAVDGVVQAIATYSVAGSTLTFSEAPPLNSVIDIRVIGESVPALTGSTFTASGTGAVARTIASKLADIVSVKDFGAACDGTADDTAEVQAAIVAAENAGVALLIPGVCKITSELVVRKPLLIQGVGPGSGYGFDGREDYVQRSGFYVTGTGTQRVRTRMAHRASSGDAQDAGLSVVLNIQAEHTTVRDISIVLQCDYSDTSHTNLGADWDVGIFNGCRVGVCFERVHVIGYFRQAGFWFDVTRQTGLPQFLDPNGVAFAAGSITNGADGCSMLFCYVYGSRWGVRVAGARPASGQTGYGPDYYDQLAATTAADARGSFGFSDFNCYGCTFYGPEHHSHRRISTFDADHTFAGVGVGAGALWIDGVAGNAVDRLQGQRLVSCRFASGETFRVRLENVNRTELIGCHIETGSAITLDAAGAALTLDYDTNTYGPVSTTTRTRNLVLFGTSGQSSSVWGTYAEYVTDLGSARASAGTATEQQLDGEMRISTGIVRAPASTDLDLRAGSSGQVRMRIDTTSKVFITATEVRFTDSSLRFGTSSGQLIQGGSGSPEGVVSAPIGSLWLRTNGGAGTSIYVKESGSGNTGWVAK